MSSTVHPQQDNLLALAYGELAPEDAKRVELHVKGCSQCAEAFGSIQRVRQTMSQLPSVPAPKRGLDSLLAYAEQAARRARSGPARTPSRWRRVLLPAAGLVALATVVVVGARVTKLVNLSPTASETQRYGPELQAPLAGKIKAPDEKRPDSEPSKTDQAEEKTLQEALVAKPSRAAPVEEPRSAGAGIGSREQAPTARARTDDKGAQKRDDTETPKREDLRRQLARHTGASKEQGADVEPLVGVGGGVEGGVVGGVLKGASENKMGRVESQPGDVAIGYARLPRRDAQASVRSELSAAAGRAREAGDRRREVALLRQAISGAQGTERAALLNRLCDALYTLGEQTEAASTCDAVVREFPDSPEATAALLRRALGDAPPAASKAAPLAPAAKGKQQPGN